MPAFKHLKMPAFKDHQRLKMPTFKHLQDFRHKKFRERRPTAFRHLRGRHHVQTHPLKHCRPSCTLRD